MSASLISAKEPGSHMAPLWISPSRSGWFRANSLPAAAQLAEDHWNLSRDQIELFVMPDALDVPMGVPPLSKPA